MMIRTRWTLRELLLIPEGAIQAQQMKLLEQAGQGIVGVYCTNRLGYTTALRMNQ
jgi:hypothetical protein